MFDKKENTKRNFTTIKLLKDNVVGENQKAVLFRFVDNVNSESFYFWINKKAIFTSQYSNILNVSLIDENDFNYSVYKEGNKDWTKPDNSVGAKTLIDAVNKVCEKTALINKK